MSLFMSLVPDHVHFGTMIIYRSTPYRASDTGFLYRLCDDVTCRVSRRYLQADPSHEQREHGDDREKQKDGDEGGSIHPIHIPEDHES